jgi:hypothetical protein
MPILILPPRYTIDSIALYGAAIEMGWEVERLQSWRAPEYLKVKDVAIYGEPLFGAVISEELSLYLLEPSFNWLANLPYQYRLRTVTFTSLEEAKKVKEPAFIKPADDKCFQATVYESGSSLLTNEVLPGTTPVLVSDPVSWEMEFRFFILNRSIATHSPYSKNGDLIRPNEYEKWQSLPVEQAEALTFCNSILMNQSVAIPPSVVIDIGYIRGRGWAVVEANASWASGIYGCDPKAVLTVISRACVKRTAVRVEDTEWILTR